MKNNDDVVTLVSRTRTFHTGYKDSFKSQRAGVLLDDVAGKFELSS